MKPALIVTSISPPNEALHLLAQGAVKHDWKFYVVGDQKSPADFQLAGCQFLSLAEQSRLPFRFARLCPPNHYARKNIGYLAAMRAGAEIIVETDDDNLPEQTFWLPRQLTRQGVLLAPVGWANVYKLFTPHHIWPRGLPLSEIRQATPSRSELMAFQANCPIQQGLADGSPDVDAIYRLVFDQDIRFTIGEDVILGKKAWCPFNSQNTTWFAAVFPLLYLPAHCSFRMTDIWRSFVAIRWLQETKEYITFHHSTVYQKRNPHNLSRDFADEVVGYLWNPAIRNELEKVPWHPDPGTFLRAVYAQMIARGWVGAEEIKLLSAWLGDLAELGLLRRSD